MAPQPAPGTGAPPTGNALSDANSQAAATPFLTPQELATLGSGLSGSISECLWPPQGSTWGVGTGLIHLQFGVPCLFTKSEARAAAGLALLIGGAIIINLGIGLLVGAEIISLVTRVAGGGKGGKTPAGGAAAEGASAPAELALAA